jgi:hypothetical protein
MFQVWKKGDEVRYKHAYVMVTPNSVDKIVVPSQFTLLWLDNTDFVFLPSHSIGGKESDLRKYVKKPQDLIRYPGGEEYLSLLNNETERKRDIQFSMDLENGRLSTLTFKPKASKKKTNDFVDLFNATKEGKVRNVSKIDANGKGTRAVNPNKNLKTVEINGITLATDNYEAFLIAVDLLGNVDPEAIESMKEQFGIVEKKPKVKTTKNEKEFQFPDTKVEAFLPQPSTVAEPRVMGDIPRRADKLAAKKKKFNERYDKELGRTGGKKVLGEKNREEEENVVFGRRNSVSPKRSKAPKEKKIKDDGDEEPEQYEDIGDIDEGEPDEFNRTQSVGSMNDFIESDEDLEEEDLESEREEEEEEIKPKKTKKKTRK